MHGNAVHDAVGSHLLRVVDVNGDSSLHPWLDEERRDAEVLLDHGSHRTVQRRNDRRDDHSLKRAIDRAVGELLDQDSVFVGGALTSGSQPP